MSDPTLAQTEKGLPIPLATRKYTDLQQLVIFLVEEVGGVGLNIPQVTHTYLPSCMCRWGGGFQHWQLRMESFIYNIAHCLPC